MGKGNWFRRERKRARGKSRQSGAVSVNRQRFCNNRTILSLEPLEDRRVLATFTVTTLQDTFLDGEERIPFAGSLRAAVNAANATEDADVIVFAVNGQITLNGGQMEIVEPLRILGNAARILTVNGGGASRIFTIADDDAEALMPVEISGLTLSGGNGTGGEDDDFRGGAIRTFERLTMNEVIFSGNSAGSGGGAVFVGAGNFTLSRSLVTQNSAQGTGGGGLLLNVDEDNAEAPAPRATVVDSTFFGNSVSGQDAEGNPAEGGAMLNVVGSLTVRQSTVAFNSAESDSDGIASFGKPPEDPEATEEPPLRETVLLSSIIYNNKSDEDDTSAFDLMILGEDVPGEEGEDPVPLESPFVSLGYNIYGPFEERFEAAPEDLGDVDPLLTEFLVNTGGATDVLYPDSESPAIDAGDTEGNNPDYRFSPTDFDQRGRHFVRIYDYTATGDATIDVGAVETQAGEFIVDLIADETDGQYSDPLQAYSFGDFALREAVLFSELNPEIDRITFDRSLNQPGGAVITLTTRQSLPISESVYIVGPDTWLLTVAAYDPTPLVKNSDGSRVFAIDDGLAANTNDILISNMTVANADAAGFGGGIFSRENLTLQALTIRNNGASLQGGGVYIQYGNLNIDGTTINNNRAGDDGGGVYVEGTDGAPEVIIYQSTISGNVAADRGAGITNDNAHVTIKYSTITKNQSASTLASGVVTFGAAAVTEIGSTIVAGNVNNDMGSYSGANAASYLSLGYNIIGNGNSTGSFVGPGDLRGVLDPKLDPLAITGGRVATHRPKPDSPAINAGDPTAVAGQGEVPEFDQRGEGFSRVYDDGSGGRIDIGAYETQPSLLVVDLGGDNDDGDYTVGNLTLREAVNIANLNPLRDTIVFDTTTLPPAITIDGTTLQLLDNVSILGPGSGVLALQFSYDGVTPAPIFTVDDGKVGLLDVEITGLEMRNGVQGAVRSKENLILDDILFLSNSSALPGGALFHEIGSLSLSNSLLTGNSTNAVNADGGAILIQNAVANIDFVTIAGNRTNQSGSDGGGLAIINSTVTGTEVTISGNSSFGGTSRGGGFYAVDSQVSLDLSVVSGNSTIGSNAVGGAIAAYNSTINLTGYTIVNLNTTLGSQSPGGGIYMSGGSLVADGAQFAQNSTLGQLSSGGAIALQAGASAIISNAALVQNSVAGSGSHGGAVYNVGSGSTPSTLTIRNSLIADNHATHALSTGGGVYSDANLLGTQKTSIVNSTISGNSAPHRGGGVFNADGLLEIFHSTITNNSTLFMNVGNGVASQATTATQTKIFSSIIAGNVGAVAGTGSDVDSVDGTLTNSIQSLGYNVIGIGNAQAIFSQAGDKAGVTNPLLGPLTDNGGDPNGAFPLMTHALLPGSPAINAGSPTFNPNLYSPALTTDQRGDGYARVKSGRIDAGAFESDLAPALPADFNGNGAVDGSDFLTWQRNFGKTGAIKADGDANGDGNVNSTDLAAWRSGYGSVAAAAAASSSSTVSMTAALVADEEVGHTTALEVGENIEPTNPAPDESVIPRAGRFDSLASRGRAAAAVSTAEIVVDGSILWNDVAAPAKRFVSVFLEEEKLAELDLLLAGEADGEAEDAVFAAWGDEIL